MRINNPAKNRENFLKYKARHPEKLKAIKRAYAVNNREKINAYRRKTYAENIEARRLHRAQYVARNRHRIRDYMRKYGRDYYKRTLKDRERRKLRLRVYRKQYPERFRKYAQNYIQKKRIARKLWIKKNWSKMTDYYCRRRLKMGKADAKCVNKISLLRRESFCHWCCRPLTESNRSIDHVIPIQRGGRHIANNLVAACKACNSSKKDKLVEEWAWTPWEEAA